MALFISGCSSGIGKATALFLKQRGYDVIASARNERDLDQLNELGLKTVQLDVCDSDAIKAAVAQAVVLSDSHTIHALVNNAGYGQAGALEDLSREQLREQFETNVFGLQELTNTVLPYMLEQKQGRIVNISSILGLIGMPFSGAYCASKYAVEGLSDTLRMELKGTGVEVCLIEPGPIVSDFRHTLIAQSFTTLKQTQSQFAATYQAMQDAATERKPGRFALPPEAVARKVYHAIHAKRPKPRYNITLPSKIFAALRRVLSTRQLDGLIRLGFRDLLKRSNNG